MASSVFISGTDTEVGKTWVSTALLHTLNGAGLRAVGMKPVASGCEEAGGALRNADALALIGASHGTIDYATCNPYALREAVAPHLAAQRSGVVIELEPIRRCHDVLQAGADVVVVEGAGGWAVPLAPGLMQGDIPRMLQLPVILVVGLRLGCINHALLSARAIVADGCRLLGWIGNAVDARQPLQRENIATLRALLPAPCLGLLAHGAGTDENRAALAPALAALDELRGATA